jgi:catechol 2,3-dioxygenase-like lactoylglutathione lyase family enzyme
MGMELEALDHVGPVVSDLARSIRWYQQVPGPHGHRVEITACEPASA